VEGLVVTRPEQVWVSDITYIRLRQGFVYPAVVMDVFTRCIRGWHLERDLDHLLTLTALEKALAGCPAPEIHHSDQGVQYAATAYTERLNEAGVEISMADVGRAWQNGYAERLIRTIKEEEVDLSEYLDYVDAYRQIGRFLDEVYMHKLIHSALGYLTPLEFEKQWQEEHAPALASPQTRRKKCPISGVHFTFLPPPRLLPNDQDPAAARPRQTYPAERHRARPNPPRRAPR